MWICVLWFFTVQQVVIKCTDMHRETDEHSGKWALCGNTVDENVYGCFSLLSFIKFY